MRKDLVLNIDYYLEEGRVVFTAKYLKDRGFCCGTGCRHCPYHPNHIKDNTNIDPIKGVTKKSNK